MLTTVVYLLLAIACAHNMHAWTINEPHLPEEGRPRCYAELCTSHTQRTSYEDHVPLGILKVGWLHKHTQLLPALVVFFFDLDWGDPQWEEKQTECVSKIQVIR